MTISSQTHGLGLRRQTRSPCGSDQATANAELGEGAGQAQCLVLGPSVSRRASQPRPGPASVSVSFI